VFLPRACAFESSRGSLRATTARVEEASGDWRDQPCDRLSSRPSRALHPCSSPCTGAAGGCPARRGDVPLADSACWKRNADHTPWNTVPAHTAAYLA
jgi:hypothetical protein